jgi:hypothetical protein
MPDRLLSEAVKPIRRAGRLLAVLVVAVSLWVWWTTRNYNHDACRRAVAFHLFLVSDSAQRAADAARARDSAAMWTRLATDGTTAEVRQIAAQVAARMLASADGSDTVAAYWRSLAATDLRGC